MPCYYPVKGYKGLNGGISFSPRSSYVDVPMQVPCGRCIGCRLERSRQWAVRIMHEVQMHDDNSFVTLTYAEDKLPPRGCLVVRDFQLFMKRLRKAYAPERISFFHCGEYGDENGRPHYHAILFGVSFPDAVLYSRNGRGESLYSSAFLSELWPHGLGLVGAVTFESAAYVARYCVKKITGQQALHYYQRVDAETGEIFHLPPEYATMSLRPGIGKAWFARYGAELEDNDSVVMRGHEMSVPRYYDKLRSSGVLKLAKRKRMGDLYKVACKGELREARVRVKELVKLSQVNFLGRKL